MPTECSADRFEFAPVAGRSVVAGFDGGRITSDAGALLLGATDRAIGLVRRFAACFADDRLPDRVEHGLATLVGQRVFALALGYEDLVDHDTLRHDPVLATVIGKLGVRRAELCAVGESKVVQWLTPEGEADLLHVARRTHRVQMLQQWSRPFQAACPDGLRVPLKRRKASRVLREEGGLVVP